jgi:hypothetical protein
MLALGTAVLAGGTVQASSYLEVQYAGPGPTEAAMVWRDGGGSSGYEGNVYTGVYRLALNPEPGSYSGPEAQALIEASAPGYVAGTFCMDLRQDAPQGAYRRYDIVTPEYARVGSGNTPIGPDRADDLRRLFGKYFTTNFSDVEAAAFQACVWEIVYERSGVYDVYSGNLHIWETWGSGWGSLANNWLGYLGDHPNMKLRALVNTTYQDYALTIPGVGGAEPVPEPATMLSAFLAISSLGLYVRKRTRLPGGNGLIGEVPKRTR